jgi:hypothetical protein
MADEPTGGSTTQSAEPGSNGAPLAGTPPVPGSPAPQSWDDPAFRKGQLDGTFRKGYGDGRLKGRKEAEQELLALLGVESIDSLRESLEAKQVQGVTSEAVQKQAEDAAASATIRKLQAERSDLAKREAALRTELDVYRRQSAAAIRAELRSRLVSMGAHDGVDDLVDVLHSKLRWAADGQSVEVIDVDADGTVRPARESYQEFLESVKATKRWFFNAPQRTGSGSAPDQAQAKPQTAPAVNSFRDRLKEYQSRR